MTVLAPGAKAPVAVPIEPCAVIDGIEIGDDREGLGGLNRLHAHGALTAATPARADRRQKAPGWCCAATLPAVS